jgi:hypothetical protein
VSLAKNFKVRFQSKYRFLFLLGTLPITHDENVPDEEVKKQKITKPTHRRAYSKTNIARSVDTKEQSVDSSNDDATPKAAVSRLGRARYNFNKN